MEAIATVAAKVAGILAHLLPGSSRREQQRRHQQQQQAMEISGPTDFVKHSHVEWDPKTGELVGLPEEWQRSLQVAVKER